MKHPQKHKLNVRRLTVYLDPALDGQVRRQAEAEDRSLSTVAERAFRAYLAVHEQPQQVAS